MTTITGLTAVRMLEIEGMSVIDGGIDGNGHLILTKHDGTTVDAGVVVGPTGAQGPQGIPGTAGVSSIPGEIKAWPNDVLPVQGTYGKWVWADGAVYATATYPVASGHINAAWKTAYGQSDPGAGNFRVPDLRGLTLAGLDQMPGGVRANRMTRSVAITIAGKTGEETHIVTVSEMPSHNHGGGVHTHGGITNLAGSSYPNGNMQGVITDGATVAVSGGSTSASSAIISAQGGGGAHENVQPTVFIPYIVRLDG